MKMCEAHRLLLKTKVVTRGLGHLISRTADQLRDKIKDEIANGQKLSNFDPLVAAQALVYDNATHDEHALRMAGFDVQEKGKACPICAIGDPSWLDSAADGVKRHAEKLGAL